MNSWEAVVEKLEEIIRELRIAVFLSGAASVEEMRNVGFILRGELAEWLRQS